jgi:hemolysin III
MSPPGAGPPLAREVVAPAAEGGATAAATGLVDRARPLWRGRIHGWAFVAAWPAGVLLLWAADGAAARTAAAIYGASLVAVFGVSAAYHRLAQSPVARARMRRLDHSMIFVVIAGTYTPICLVALPPAWGLPLLVTVWLGAVAGIVLKSRSVERFAHSANALYLVLGWAAVAVVPAILRSMPIVAIVLMGVGGLAYTLGATVLFRRRPDPWPVHFGYHEIWHACTVLAGGCHFVMIWLVIAAAA